MVIFKKIVYVFVIATSFSACGGGGGGGGATEPVASTNAFNLQSGLMGVASNGFNKTFAISGTCTGTFTLAAGPASNASSFEGAFALSATETSSGSFTGCSISNVAGNIIRYYDANYMPKGFLAQDGRYGVYATTPIISTAVHVGDTAAVSTINLYTDSSKTISNGQQVISYMIEADTATTAIVNMVYKNYDASSVLKSTEQDRYRMGANGTLTPISLDIQYTNGSTMHLIGS